MIDLVRAEGAAIWGTLDERERARLLRHLRPFWDVHRYRVPPMVESVLDSLARRRRLDWVAGRPVDAGETADGIVVRYRPRGARAVVEERFDTVVVATGPDHASALEDQPRAARADGRRRDPARSHRLGIEVDDGCRAVSATGVASGRLLVAGPLARGCVGELMGVPEVARHAAGVAAVLHEQLPAMAETAAPYRVAGRR